jgi:hypothetical protein
MSRARSRFNGCFASSACLTHSSQLSAEPDSCSFVAAIIAHYGVDGGGRQLRGDVREQRLEPDAVAGQQNGVRGGRGIGEGNRRVEPASPAIPAIHLPLD